jgi:translation initiation factor 4A
MHSTEPNSQRYDDRGRDRRDDRRADHQDSEYRREGGYRRDVDSRGGSGYRREECSSRRRDYDSRDRYERRDDYGSRGSYDRRGHGYERDRYDRRSDGYRRHENGDRRHNDYDDRHRGDRCGDRRDSRDERYDSRHEHHRLRHEDEDDSRTNGQHQEGHSSGTGRSADADATDAAGDNESSSSKDGHDNTSDETAPDTRTADPPADSAETTSEDAQGEELSVPTDLESFESFEEMKLDENLFRGILAHGFEKPSAIQQKAIPTFLKYKNDIIAQAQSGTGKTATFSVSLLQMVDDTSDKLQGVIMAPTRELATQIHSVITSIGQFTKKRIALVSGGGNVRDCVDRLRRESPHIMVATPGRMKHLLRDQLIDCRALRYLIMDEADEMLSEGFQDDIRDIVSYVPETVRIGLYSATMPTEMDAIAKQFMRNPIEIRVKEDELTLEGINQFKVILEDGRQKFACLMDLFSDMSIYQMMIYCNSKRSVDNLKYDLDQEQIPCEAIHGQMMTCERNEIMQRFRSGDVRVLVTTDLTARGIDVQQVSLVINYDFPHDIATYLHRIGRGGRFGRKGFAINMVVHDRGGGYDGDRGRRRRVNDMENLRRVTEYYQTQIKDLPEDLKQAFSS